MVQPKIAVLTALLLAVCALASGSDTPGTPVDAVVVLGHRPARDERGEVDYETRARVERGVALVKEGRAARLLVTGGESVPGVIEADVMADYAAGLGVDAVSILRERASRDTIENARLSLIMLRRLQPEHTPRIVLVTSDYHLERATELFRCAGAEVEAVPVKLPELSRWARSQRRIREWFVHVAYWFEDECARARGQGEAAQR
jgi:uncharacterized SAM-binding protein YcdF (DUF218 family)